MKTVLISSIRKHSYSNILKILSPQKGKFSEKKSDIFYIPSQNIDCGYSLELPRQAVLTSTHNLCFEQKLAEQCIPL